MTRDPGLAAERTHLAWNRTGWSMAAAALAVVRQTAVSERRALVAFAGVSLTLAAALWFWAARPMNQSPTRPARRPQVTGAAAATLTLALCGIVLAFT